MKPNSVAIAVVLDKSGSMGLVREGTITGFNTYVDNQKNEPGEATLTLVFFDTEYDVKYVDKPLADVKHLAPEDYYPGGNTALNDAIARAITEIGAKLAAKPEKDRPAKVVMVIVTDGQENSSKEYKLPEGTATIKKMIEHQEKTYSWQFIFLGAGLDAVKQAASYGIDASRAAQYDAGQEKSVFRVASASTSRARSGGLANITDVERGSLRSK